MRLFALLVLAALAAAPLAYAHVDGMPYGTPKLYCEDSPLAGDQLIHDYGPPATGLYVGPPFDGSIPMGLYPLLPGGCAYAADIPNQWDAHFEWATGGAYLLACEWACGSNGTGGGSSGCWGTYADHEQFPTVWVLDHALSAAGASVSFSVMVDVVSVLPPPLGWPDCGDLQADFGVSCVDHCTVPFPPGLDGSYIVCVTGTQGHVWTAGGGPAPDLHGPPPHRALGVFC